MKYFTDEQAGIILGETILHSNCAAGIKRLFCDELPEGAMVSEIECF
jgi:hypothetical protein